MQLGDFSAKMQRLQRTTKDEEGHKIPSEQMKEMKMEKGCVSSLRNK